MKDNYFDIIKLFLLNLTSPKNSAIKTYKSRKVLEGLFVGFVYRIDEIQTCQIIHLRSVFFL